jgi:hypothetical protein
MRLRWLAAVGVGSNSTLCGRSGPRSSALAVDVSMHEVAATGDPAVVVAPEIAAYRIGRDGVAGGIPVELEVAADGIPAARAAADAPDSALTSVERQAKLPVELNRGRCHPARGECITSNVTLGSPRMSGLRGKSEVNDEFPRQTRAAGPGPVALSSRQARPALCHPG